jgi:predicted MFS family arabinose efflux permease
MSSSSPELPDGSVGQTNVIRVVLACALVIGLGAVSANTIGYIIPDLMQDLSISRAAAGLITGLFFGATGVGAFAAGRVVPRFGARRALIAASATVTVLATASGVIGSYWILLLYGLFCGFAYSLATVGTNVIVASVVPERRRGVALTAKTSLAPFFSGSSSILVGFFIDKTGWRTILFVIAGLCALVALNSSLSLPQQVKPAIQHKPDKAKSIRARPIVYVYGLAVFLSSGGGSAFFLWIVPFLRQDLELNSRNAGLVAGIMTMFSALGMVGIAFFSDRLGVRRRFDVIIGLTGVCGVVAAFLVVAQQLSSGVVVLLLSIGVLTVATNSGLMHAAIVELAPDAVAQATGITLTGYYLGAFVAPYLFGFIADQSGYPTSWLASGIALGISTTLLVWIRLANVRHDQNRTRLTSSL